MRTLVFLFILLLHSACSSLIAQQFPILTEEEAIKIGLNNNYNILIAENQYNISKANNTNGNAGMLPQVSLNLGQTYNINNTKQEFFSGDTRTGSGVNSNGTTANITALWTLYNGKQMFVEKEKLEKIEQLSSTELQSQTEQIIYQIKNMYLQLQYQTQVIQIARTNLALTKDRLDLMKLRKDVGTGSGLSVMQAQADYNQDSIQFVNAVQKLKQLKIQLNNTLVRHPDTEFDVTEKIENVFPESIETSLTKGALNNRNQIVAEQMAQIAELDIKYAQGAKLPIVNLNTGYNFARSQTELGLLKYSQNLGFNVGITGKWILYDGNNVKRNIQIAKLKAQDAELRKNQNQQQLENQIFTVHMTYQQALELEKIADSNVSIAEVTLATTREMMTLGQITNLDLRQAEVILAEAKFKKLNAHFEKLYAILDINYLTGSLLK
ncbi:MAG: TolC family protein [Lewinellaceae bacterium]|nr:TolC family protein [Lewinellaceae bacterium]